MCYKRILGREWTLNEADVMVTHTPITESRCVILRDSSSQHSTPLGIFATLSLYEPQC